MASQGGGRPRVISVVPSDGVYRILVTIHNVINVPVEMQRVPPATVFLVCARVSAPTYDAAMTSPKNPQVAVKFGPGDLVERNDLLQMTKTASVEWAIGLPQGRPTDARVEIMIDIAERMPESKGRSLVKERREWVDLQAVLDRKIVTKIIGTPCGQVGLSFEVAPTDKSGFAARLTRFMEMYNPAGVARVKDVVEKATEIASFTRIYKKYELVDYPGRVRRFFHMYGPDLLDHLDSALADWKDREEEFVRSLVLDNGPEPSEIPVRARIAAFAETHGLDLDADALAASHANDYDNLFTTLTEQYGREPDPRSYLFPPVVYPRGTGSASVASEPPAAGPTPVARQTPAVSSQPAQPTAAQAPPQQTMQPQPTQTPGQRESSMPSEQSFVSRPAQQQQQAPPPASMSSAASSVAPYVIAEQQRQQQQQQALFLQQQQQQQMQDLAAQRRSSSAGQQPPLAPATQAVASRFAAAAPANDLWNAFTADLQRCHIPPAEVHYLNADAFTALLEELRFPQAARSQLAAEWQRRLQEALQVQYLAPGDQAFETAKAEVVGLSGLEAINVQVLGVVALRNAEHETGFSVRLASAKVRAAERCLLLGDHGKLMDAAKHGVSAALLGAKALTIPKRPFSSLERPASIALLVCDVVIGKPYYADHRGPAGVNVTADFAAEFDSIISGFGTASHSATVFSPQQVLPRFLVHCSVDPTVSPCPAHPNRPVEYFVVEPRVFACSQCVVMGAHRGATVVTVDEAVAEARQRLSDVQRETESIMNEFAAAEAEAQHAVDELQNGRARREVADAAEEVKREAERRATQMLLEFDAEVTKRGAVASDSKERIARSRVELTKATEPVAAALRSSNPSQVMRAFMEAAPSLDLPAWRHHAEEAKMLASSFAAAPIMHSAMQASGAVAPGSSYSFVDAASRSTLPDGFRAPGPVRPRQDQTPFSPIAGSRVLRADAFMTQPSQQGFGGPAGGPSSVAPWASRAQAAAAAANASHTRETTANSAASLYEKFMHLKGAKFVAGASSAGPGPAPRYSGMDASFANTTHMTAPLSFSSPGASTQPRLNNMLPQSTMTPSMNSSTVVGAPGGGPARRSTSANTLSDREKKSAKEQMAQGWSAYRAGDKATAHRLWTDIFERHEHTAVGARARAYVCEAIDKDIEQAATWYERALRHDPGDVMTLFNYGVMLEGANRKKEAISLFETAGRLGDHTAAKRAETLRRTTT